MRCRKWCRFVCVYSNFIFGNDIDIVIIMGCFLMFKCEEFIFGVLRYLIFCGIIVVVLCDLNFSFFFNKFVEFFDL